VLVPALYAGPFHSRPPTTPGQTWIGVVVTGFSAFSRVVTGTSYTRACVSRSSTRSMPSLPDVATKRRIVPLMLAVKSGVTWVRSQSCESFGTSWRCQRSFPVRTSSTTIEFVYRLLPLRSWTGRSGAGLVTAMWRSPASVSRANAVHTPPPPTGMSFSACHVSDPGSPGFGTVLNRQTGEPSVRRNAPTQPWMLRSLTAGPRSEEHTSELQSLAYLVCRLLLEKKNNYRFPILPTLNNNKDIKG